MPQSDHWALPWVLETAQALNPTSVLDVGVGMGQYGLHLRQLLDISRERLTRVEWKTRVDGVELYEPYRNPIWDYYYDAVHLRDARDFLRGLDREYDLILICDVIEHFDRAEAEALLALARAKGKWVIVTTPNGAYPQGAMFGNEAETHRSEWVPQDFLRLGGAVHEIRATFMAVLRGTADNSVPAPRVGQLPTLFENTGRSLFKCARRWLPRMIKARLGGQPS
jgi:2-polyprenyl-3-methyl-5-hydroxy-6-metoxy-1,4-benzoquinol methylase